MKLELKKAARFLELYKGLLQYVFILNTGDEIDTLEDYLEARNLLFDDTSIIDEFIDEAKGLKDQHLKILSNIKQGIIDNFIYVKTLKKHSIFLSDSIRQFYCVLGITDSIDDLAPGKFSLIKTAIFNFENVIICDGLFSHQNVSLGPNLKKEINYQYALAKKNKELIKHITNC